MNLLLFGATGMVGQRVLSEALRRGHTVTAVARDPSKVTGSSLHLSSRRGDVTDAASVAALTAGHDVVVSAVAPPAGREGALSDVARALVQAVAAAEPPPRLIWVGGAGILRVAPGTRLIDTPAFPASLKAIAQAHIDAYAVLQRSAVDWTFFAPAALIQPGERTGTYRTATDQLVVDAAGTSRISAEDYAVGLLDEVETPKFKHGLMTAGY
ncbi:MAG TPA: NAD(P)H-binding protein [Gemmataceae bacterium]|nr:NAD(P)H-binding protein [Gemmataceae bacterium]